MAPNRRAVVIGDRALQTKFRKLAEGGVVAAEQAVRAAGAIIEPDAKRRVKSSTVRDRIRSRSVPTRRPGRAVRSVEVRHERGPIEEFGSGARRGKRGPHNFPARPYLRPAFDENEEAIKKEIGAVFVATVNRVALSGHLR